MTERISVAKRKLTDTDRKILKVLLERGSRPSTKALAERIGVPVSTVERRRRILEKNVLTTSYFIDLRPYGFKRIEFLIETGSGLTARVAKQLMNMPEVIAVSKTIGEHTIDLIAELIVKDNSQTLDLSEVVKGMHGVRDVIWTEVIEEQRKNNGVPDYIIDSL